MTTGECAIDNSSMPDNGQLDPAWQLIVDTNSSLNYICPAKDEDYFWFTTTTDGTILSVHLWNNVTTSPLNLCYAIIPDTDHNQTLGSTCRGATIGQIDIQATHYIAKSGTYFIKVWAENGKEDRRNPYLVEIREVHDPTITNRTTPRTKPRRWLPIRKVIFRILAIRIGSRST